MVGVGGSNPLSRTNSKKHLKKKHYLLLITRSKGRWFESTQSYQFKKTPQEKALPTLNHPLQGSMLQIHSVVPIQKIPQEKALPTLNHPLQGSVVRIHSVVPIQKISQEKALPTLNHPVQGSVVRIHSVVPIQKNTTHF